MKKRFIAYAIFFTLLGGYTIFMYVDDYKTQKEEFEFEQANANQPKSNDFGSNIEKIKSGEIKVQNYIYPTYIPDGYEYVYDLISIYEEDSEYYDEAYKSERSKSLNFDLKDSFYQSNFIYQKPFKEGEVERKISMSTYQCYVDSKNIFKAPHNKSVITLENFQKDCIKYDKKNPYLKIIEQKELSTQDTIFDKIFFQIDDFEKKINLYLFKKIEPIGECDYLMINITFNTTFERDPDLINLEEIEEIIKGLKVS